MIDEILKDKIIDRKFYSSKLKKFIGSPVIKVLIGQRRVGKSCILKNIIKNLILENKIKKENVFYINKELPIFDSIKNYHDILNFFYDFKKNKKGTLFIGIDEVQEINGWEKFVNGMLATYKDIEIFITGSNSSMLSGELATYISGRYVEFQINSLSFDEFCVFKKKKQSKELFLEYLKYGGLPGIFHMEWNEEVIFNYLKGVYNTIVLKDIVSRNNVKNINFFEELYKYTLSNIGNIFNAKSITDYLKSKRIKISVDSVINYLKYAEQTFLLNKIYSVDPNTKKYFEIYNKYYVGDIGLRNSLVGYSLSKDIGKLLENYVFLVLQKHGYNIKIGRLKSGKEIDFIAEKNGTIIYLQISTSIIDDNTRIREYASFYEINDNWPKYVVSFDDIDFGEKDGVKHINIMNLEKIL